MKQSVIEAILSYVAPTEDHMEVDAATKLPISHEMAQKIASKHHKGSSHVALTKAIKANDKHTVHEHFKAAKAHVMEQMDRYHKGTPKPAAKSIGMHDVKLLKHGTAKSDLNKKKQPFLEFAKGHPEFHAGAKSKTGKHKHMPGTLAGRAFDLGHASRSM